MTSFEQVQKLQPDIVDPKCSLADWLFEHLRKYAAEGKVAQILADDGSSWSYEELLRNSVHVAAGLEEVGIKRGDVVSLVTRNSHELFAVVIGCVLADVIFAPSVAELSPDALRSNFEVIKPQFVVVGASFISKVEESINGADPSLDPKPKILEIKKLFKDAVEKGSYADPATFSPAKIEDPNSHAFTYSFSSGTTGKQKAVMLTDPCLSYGSHLSSMFNKRCERSCIINGSQLHWISWWFTLTRGVKWGWTRIIMSEVDTIRMLDAIHKYKPSLFFGPPGSLWSIAEAYEANPSRWDISSLSVCMSGGDLLPKSAHERLVKMIKTDVYQEYGSTEVGAIVMPDLEKPIVYGSVGKAVKKLKFVDPKTGEEVQEPDKRGEIRVKDIGMRGYLSDPEATANAFDEHGWLKMGDIATFNEFGDIFIVDRDKEMFKYRNYQISPSELEDIIKKCPGVNEVAVVGKSAGNVDGQVPTAFVVKAPGSKLSEQDIHTFLAKENVHDSMTLRGGVIFTDEIPKNPNGKVVRTKLREILNRS